MRSTAQKSDVTVVGGGLAGVAAAIAAARLGSAVALINNRPVLGGNSSSEIRVWVCGATAHGAQKFAGETGIMGELFSENQYRNPEGNPHLWDMVVLDAVRAEPGIRLYLNTDVHDVEARGDDSERHIESVTGWQAGSETAIRFESPIFIDATGDGLVGMLAGAHFSQGREARSVFDEPWAPVVPDAEMLGSTLLFYTKDVGEPVRFVAPDLTKDITATSILDHRRISADANGCDYWWIEWGGELDAVDDDEAIRDELWSVVYGIWDHIKNSGQFDADTLTLEWVGSLPGKREYRRFVGDHVLTQHDVMNQVRFDDSIGFGGWSIDLHPPGGMYSSEAASKHLFTSGVYHVPFRSLYSVNVDNMMMAGRNISASHVAFGTTRVMATCAVLGEAAGSGAALAARLGITPRQVGSEHKTELRRALLEQDASLVGAPWDDPRDLALTARAIASSTLTSLVVEPRDAHDGTSVSFADEDIAVLLPIENRLDSIDLLFDVVAPVQLEAELWSTAAGENHIPVRFLASRTANAVTTGRTWLTFRFDHRSDGPEDVVVVVLRRAAGAALVVVDRPGPYGILGLMGRIPNTPGMPGHPQTNAWSAVELRRRTPCLRAFPETTVYSPDQVIGGYQRPFDGPQMWSSEAMIPGRNESIELRWDHAQTVARVDLVFNSDVDHYLINLHHQRSPFPVIPELVKRYRLEILEGEEWVPVARIDDNRRRLRRHVLENPITARGLRLLIEETNGSEYATVVAMRAFASSIDAPRAKGSFN